MEAITDCVSYRATVARPENCGAGEIILEFDDSDTTLPKLLDGLGWHFYALRRYVLDLSVGLSVRDRRDILRPACRRLQV